MVRHVLLDDPSICIAQHHRASCVTDEFLRPFDHAMALTSGSYLDLPIGRHFEALFGARFRLHLGHFALQL